MASTAKHSRRPPLACEIAADRVLAGRASDAGRMVEVASARELAPGTVVPDLMEANLRDGAAVRQAIESALGSLGSRSRDVIAILPDTAVSCSSTSKPSRQSATRLKPWSASA